MAWKGGEWSRQNGRKGGRKKGIPNKVTTAKKLEEARELEALKQLILQRITPMTLAQMQNAEGMSEVFLKDEAGKWTRLEDPLQIEAALNMGGRGVRIFTKAPNVTAYQELLNRAFGKATERVEVGNADGKPLQVEYTWRKSR